MEERMIATMKIKKTTVFSLTLTGLILVGSITAFATSANARPQQAESVEQDSKIETISKQNFIPQIDNNAGIFYKEDGKLVKVDSDNVETAILVEKEDFHGVSVKKNSASMEKLCTKNVVYFDTEAEREEHFRALEANVEKGLERYAGFEDMYANIDISAPVTYIVK